MKIKSAPIVIFLATIIMISCQMEEVIIKDNQGQTIDNMSPLADLVNRTTLKDGSVDNIIDNSSCLTVILPVNVTANGVALTISTKDDYKLIEIIFDEFTDDTDVLEISYPIEVLLPDYDIEEINSAGDLADTAEDCLEGGVDDDIECLDFRYPIVISVYNSVSQVTDLLTVNNDEELNNFIDNLEDNLFISFNYPLLVVLSDSSEVEVNSNDQLASLIEQAEDNCDEDDDNDYNDDDIDDSELMQTILSTSWVITYYADNEERTAAFANMVFAFKDNDLAYISIGEDLIRGEWETYGDAGLLEVEMEFPKEHPLDLLDENWQVTSFNHQIIELSYPDSEGTIYLTFGATDLVVEPGPTVADYIVNGEWVVASYKNDGIDETDAYAGYKISFTSDTKLTYYNAVEVFDGAWEEVLNVEEHLLSLSFSSEVASFDKLENEWVVVAYTESRIELTSVDTESDAIENLVLEKL